MGCTKTEIVHVAQNPYHSAWCCGLLLMYSSVTSEEPFWSSFGDGRLAINVGMLWIAWGTSSII